MPKLNGAMRSENSCRSCCWIWCLGERSKVLLVAGAFLVFFPSGVFMYWGNLSVYVNSYIARDELTDRHKEFPAPWIISTFLVFNNLGITTGRQLCSWIGRRQTTLVAIFLFNSGLFLSSVTISHSLTSTCISFGSLTGLGSGLLYSSVIADVIDWCGVNVGFLTQIVTTGYNVGAVLTNQCVTFYVNPRNADVDIARDSVSYFSSQSVLEAVPRVFIILGVYTFIFQMLGLSLIHVYNCCGKPRHRIENVDEEAKRNLLNDDDVTVEELDCGDRCDDIDSDHTEINDDEERNESLLNNDTLLGATAVETNIKTQNDSNLCYKYVVTFIDERESGAGYSEFSAKPIEMDQNVIQVENRLENRDIKPHYNTDTFSIIADASKHCKPNSKTYFYPDELNCLKKSNIFANVKKSKHSSDMATATQKVEHGCNSNLNADLLSEYYPAYLHSAQKKYGKIRCTTDVSPKRLFCFKTAYAILSIILAKHIAFNLLSNYYKTLGEIYIHNDQFLATLGSLLSLMSIAVKPAIGSLVDKFGIRTPTIISLITLCINSAVYPITPRIDKWMYLVFSLLFEISICAVNACCSLGTLLILGKKYFTTNLGLLASATILLDVLSPIFIQTVLMHYGWVALFSGASLAVLVALVITVTVLPYQ